MRHYRIRKGLLAGQGPTAPDEIAREVAPVEVAYLGADYPGLRPRFEVAPGDRVAVGQTLFTDRRHREVTFASPVAGVVAETGFAPRRMLSICRVRAEGDQRGGSVPVGDGASRDVLLARGLWPGFRARPFGVVPRPDAVPAAIVVNAVRATREAPDPAMVLAEQGAAFARGLEVLVELTPGTVHVAQSEALPLGPEAARVRYARFTGRSAAGLSGTQIDRLCPVGVGAEVWSIGYQDVAAIGHLFETGLFAPERVVAVAEGEGDGASVLVRTRFGARLADLVTGGGRDLVSGRAGLSRRALFLGHGHECVGRAVGPERVERRGALSAIIPTRGVERALAVDLMAVPLMKALTLGDSTHAAALGCLGLVEEDVAALSRHCTSGTDYEAALRTVLDALMAEAA